MREALSRLFRSIGMRAQIFASAHDFLTFKRPDAPPYLVLDVRLVHSTESRNAKKSLLVRLLALARKSLYFIL
jgi:FixJ family two-component response regulator